MLDGHQKSINDSLSQTINSILSQADMFVDSYKNIFNDDLKKILTDEIVENYALEKNRTESSAYTSYIRILDLMIEGLSYANSQTEAEFKAQKKLNWEDLQRAYFKGDVMYLRKFDKTYDDKVLRFINNISPINGQKDIDSLIKFLETKNKQIKLANFKIINEK